MLITAHGWGRHTLLASRVPGAYLGAHPRPQAHAPRVFRVRVSRPGAWPRPMLHVAREASRLRAARDCRIAGKRVTDGLPRCHPARARPAVWRSQPQLRRTERGCTMRLSGCGLPHAPRGCPMRLNARDAQLAPARQRA